MPARKAASVLPEPVGAAMRTSRPERITGQPAAWASVGAAKRRRNQAWRTGWKGARGSEPKCPGLKPGASGWATARVALTRSEASLDCLIEFLVLRGAPLSGESEVTSF